MLSAPRLTLAARAPARWAGRFDARFATHRPTDASFDNKATIASYRFSLEKIDALSDVVLSRLLDGLGWLEESRFGATGRGGR